MSDESSLRGAGAALTYTPGVSETEEEIPLEIEDDGLERRRWVLRRALPGRRLDKYLADRLKHLTRTAVTRMIREGYITVNGKPAKPAHEPKEGDTVDLAVPPVPQTDIAAEDMPLKIIYEDESMLVIDKQAGVSTHPARGNWTGTLVNGVLGYAKNLSKLHEDPFRPGVVHRLDKNTTGLIVFAKTEEAHWRLAVQWENRKVEKEYLAILEGEPQLRSDWIDAPIGKHPTVREKYAVRPENGKASLTFYEVLERFVGYTLIRCEIHTGRTHQIRVHMSHTGFPVVADDAYGRRAELWRSDLLRRDRGDTGGWTEDRRLLGRQALHAHRLKLRHPITDDPMELVAPLPPDMLDALEQMRELCPKK